MNPLLLLLLVIPVCVWAVNTLLNLLAGALRWRLGPHSTPFVTGAFINGAALPLFFEISLDQVGLKAGEVVLVLVYGVVYVNSLLFFNWFFFTLTDVSMHIHLLLEIGRQGSIRIGKLKELYNKDRILRARIPRLLELQQLGMKEGRLVLNGSAVLFGAFVCKSLRRALGIPLRPEQAHPDQGC